MKKLALLAIGLGAVALSACAPRYYDDRYGYDRYGYGDRYYGPPPGAEYGDRDRNDDRHAQDPDQGRDRYRDYRDQY